MARKADRGRGISEVGETVLNRSTKRVADGEDPQRPGNLGAKTRIRSQPPKNSVS